MHSTTLLTGLLAMSTTGWAQYRLQHDYMQGGPGSFLSNFAFFTAPDPTNGFVEYVDQGTAQGAGMISTSTGSVRLGVNSRDTTTTGRQSIRLTSHNTYESGLVVLDLSHMPGGVCGTWPAFWMVGPNWPTQGEIDIIEGVNDQAANQMTLHTGSQCSIGGGSMLGNIIGNNCDVSGGDNTGCGIGSNDRATYGTGFNQAGGGTYATEWSSSAISVYFFPRGKEPQDINSGNPNPASWGEPLAHFSGGCDMSRSFTNQQIIFDTTFCGDWAGEVWGSSGCSAHAPTCEAYVGQNPSAFKDMYWEINSLKVFSGSSGPAAPGQSYAPSGSYGAQSTFARSTVAASGAPSGAPFGRPNGPASQGPSYAPAPSGGPSPSYVPPSANPAPSGAAPLPSWAPQPSSPYQGPADGGARATAGGAINGGAHRGPPGAEAARANYLAAHMENMPTIQQRETEPLDNAAIMRHARNHLEQHKRWHGHGHGHF